MRFARGLAVSTLILLTIAFAGTALADAQTMSGPNQQYIGSATGPIRIQNYNGVSNPDLSRVQRTTPDRPLIHDSCTNGFIYYTLPDSRNIYRPETPLSCKNFEKKFPVAKDGNVDPMNRLVLDQNRGALQIDGVTSDVRWPADKAPGIFSLHIKNIGKVSIEVLKHEILVGNSQFVSLSPTIKFFPKTYVLRPGDELFVPIGTMVDLARVLSVDFYDSTARYAITSSTNAPCNDNGDESEVNSIKASHCHFAGFAIMTTYNDIFGEKSEIPTVGYFQTSHDGW